MKSNRFRDTDAPVEVAGESPVPSPSVLFRVVSSVIFGRRGNLLLRFDLFPDESGVSIYPVNGSFGHNAGLIFEGYSLIPPENMGEIRRGLARYISQVARYRNRMHPSL